MCHSYIYTKVRDSLQGSFSLSLQGGEFELSTGPFPFWTRVPKGQVTDASGHAGLLPPALVHTNVLFCELSYGRAAGGLILISTTGYFKRKNSLRTGVYWGLVVSTGEMLPVVPIINGLIRYNSDPKVPLDLSIETITINGTDTYAITCEINLN